MKNKKYYLSIGILCTLTLTHADITTCSSNPDFAKNSCDVCFTGGATKITNSDITLINENKLPWKNSSTENNQIFYRDAQQKKELITNYGTASDTWLGKGIAWDKSITWADTDGQKTYTLEIGKEFPLRTIDANTVIPIDGYKPQTSGSIIIKIPVSFYEVNDETFERSDVINKNYCVSYTASTGALTSNTTTPNITPSTPTITIPTTSPINTTITPPTVTNASPQRPNTVSVPTTTQPTNTFSTNNSYPDSSNNTRNTQYNENIRLNSAERDISASTISRVEVGPGDNLLLFLAACMISLIFLPKINTYFSKN